MGSGSQDSSVFLESRKSVLKPWEMKWGRWEGARSGRAGKVTSSFLKGTTMIRVIFQKDFSMQRIDWQPRGCSELITKMH